MASFRMRLYDSPADELAPLLEGETPRWVEHILRLRGDDLRQASTSSLLEVLSEAVHRRLTEISLVARKAEARGWSVTLDGTTVLISSGVSENDTRALLEQDGVWHLVRSLAAQGRAQVFA